MIGRPKIRDKFPQLTDDLVAEFIARIERIAVRIEKVSAAITLARDPKDEPYLDLAAHSQADFLVTRDRDLLESADAVAQSVPNLQIVDPVAFLATARAQIGRNF